MCGKRQVTVTRECSYSPDVMQDLARRAAETFATVFGVLDKGEKDAEPTEG